MENIKYANTSDGSYIYQKKLKKLPLGNTAIVLHGFMVTPNGAVIVYGDKAKKAIGKNYKDFVMYGVFNTLDTFDLSLNEFLQSVMIGKTLYADGGYVYDTKTVEA